MLYGQPAQASDIQPPWQGPKDREWIEKGQKMLQTVPFVAKKIINYRMKTVAQNYRLTGN